MLANQFQAGAGYNSAQGERVSTEDSDTRLLERLRLRQGQEEAAFEELFLRYYGPVYRVVYRLMVNHEATEDLVQETFLALYDQPPRIKPEVPLAVWLYRVALNRGYNVLRGARRERQRWERLEITPGEADPEAEILRAEERTCVQAALARLSERQYKLLVLRQAGLTHAEIAAVLEIATGSVGSLLDRAERAFLVAYEREKIVESKKSGKDTRAGNGDVRKQNG